MINSLKQEILKHGDKSEIVPISRLEDIRMDTDNLKSSGLLNKFQENLIDGIYIINSPAADFEINSIIIVASPSPSLARITFNWKGNQIPLMLPASYIDMETVPERIEHYLNEFLILRGHHVKYTTKLPHKLLAVRSGLGLYGKNNICYVEGMGSFQDLTLFFSDILCTEDNWTKIRHMNLCNTCEACLNNCPTKAITKERFLLDTDRCLTYYNEADSKFSFPEWIDINAHNCIYGCHRCQTVCPQNKNFSENIISPANFTEEETSLLLEGKPLDQYPKEVATKLKELNMTKYLKVLPRNLKVLFEKES
jgi:epoxyqueuosine reductase